MAFAIKALCRSLPVNKIIAITVSGFAARIISAQNIDCPIIAVTNKKELARGFNIYSNTKGIYINIKYHKDNVNHIPNCLKYLWKINEISKNDFILVVALGYPSSGRRMNFIQTHYVKDLIKILQWK